MGFEAGGGIYDSDFSVVVVVVDAIVVRLVGTGAEVCPLYEYETKVV